MEAKKKACQLAASHVAALNGEDANKKRPRWTGFRGGDHLVQLDGEEWAVDLVLETVS